MRIKFLCVLDGVIHEVPIYKMKNGKMVKPELADKTVIMMEIVYETKDRKPFKIMRINFSKAYFDDRGIHDIESVSNSKEIGIKLEYIFSDFSEEPNPLPIPIAPELPTEKEVALIVSYLNRKYPYLLINSPTAIEQAVSESKENHKKEIRKMKLSHKK